MTERKWLILILILAVVLRVGVALYYHASIVGVT